VLLDYYSSETLTKLGISIADAEAGQVKHMPAVPGVQPESPQDILHTAPSNQQQNPETPATPPPATTNPAPQEPAPH